MKKKSYRVEITRTVVEYCYIYVKATDEEKAGELALEQSYERATWHFSSSDYQATAIHEE